MHNETWGDPRDPREHRGGHRGRGRTQGRAPWPGPVGPFEFGMRGGPFGPPRFGGRGPRVRRGDVRAAILDLLGEGQPWNGYQIIQEIGARTQGVWRPSAGSVYPALQQL
ncbi:MAG: PadR family transcriptional regulator, partial [Streptosporangiaceae bacterium]